MTTNEGAAGIVGACAQLEKAIRAASIKALKKSLAVLEIEQLGSKDELTKGLIIAVRLRVNSEIFSRGADKKPFLKIQ